MNRILRFGDHGEDVRAAQDALNFHIRRLQPLETDGKFGKDTKARVMEFQKSNGLQVDGSVGSETNGKLFEIEVQAFSLGIVPITLLNFPKIGSGASTQPPGIGQPTLIPPLRRPTFTSLQLLPSSISFIPPLNKAGQILNLTLTVPARNDPHDPKLRSFQQIVQVLETLPPNFPFRTMIIGAVPNPVKKIVDIGLGFKWGIDPVFDLKKLKGPSEFVVGAKGSASYTLGVINQAGPGLKMAIFVKGDFKAQFDYTSRKAASHPLFILNGSIIAGVEVRF